MNEQIALGFIILGIATIPPLYWLAIARYKIAEAYNRTNVPIPIVRLTCALEIWRGRKLASPVPFKGLGSETIIEDLPAALNSGPLKIENLDPILSLYLLQALETRNAAAALDHAIIRIKEIKNEIELAETIQETNRETAPGRLVNSPAADAGFKVCHNCRYYLPWGGTFCLIDKDPRPGLAGLCADWMDPEPQTDAERANAPKK